MKSQYTDSQYTLKEEQVLQLINATKNLRDKIIIESAYFPALRRFEIAKMRVEEINFSEGLINVVGKGNKQAPIPVGIVYPQYMSDLKHYIEYVKRKEGYIFSIDGKKLMNVSRINQIFNDTAKLAGLSNPNKKKRRFFDRRNNEHNEVERNINPHLLRHSQARHLKNLGFNIEFIKNYMRHDELGTTMNLYGTMSIEDMKNYARNKVLTDNKLLQ